MSLMRMCRKNDTLPYNGGSHTILATSTKLLDIKSDIHSRGGPIPVSVSVSVPIPAIIESISNGNLRSRYQTIDWLANR